MLYSLRRTWQPGEEQGAWGRDRFARLDSRFSAVFFFVAINTRSSHRQKSSIEAAQTINKQLHPQTTVAITQHRGCRLVNKINLSLSVLSTILQVLPKMFAIPTYCLNVHQARALTRPSCCTVDGINAPESSTVDGKHRVLSEPGTVV